MSRREARGRAVELLAMVDIPRPADRIKDYPHQFSGGMRQRVMIAMAIACNPKILIADEPTTALDVTCQAGILRLVKRLRHELQMGVIWVTHDLAVVAGLADKVIVMYAGSIVEEGPVGEVYKRPRHPYTAALLNSVPRLDVIRQGRLANIEGMPPDMTNLGDACPFRPRCGRVGNWCRESSPVMHVVSEGHRVACWLYADAGKEP
jgi:oligopeptide transport system ATP-binding protein